MDAKLVNYGDGPRAIFEMLKIRILSGELEAESELKIMPLAEELGVSIAPVREAVRMLAGEDLIELRPRRSPIIARIDQNDLLEINMIRRALECEVLKDAVPRHTNETLDLCEAVLIEDAKCADLWAKAELNKKFHFALLAPSNLHRTVQLISKQYTGMARIIHYRLVNYLAENPELAFAHAEEHRSLLDAVREGDPEKAAMLMDDHIGQATDRAQHIFGDQEASR